MSAEVWWQRLRRHGRLWRDAARLMVGIPDYDNYVAQQRRHNPNAPVMNQRQFLDYCHKRRCGGGNGSRCC